MAATELIDPGMHGCCCCRPPANACASCKKGKTQTAELRGTVCALWSAAFRQVWAVLHLTVYVLCTYAAGMQGL